MRVRTMLVGALAFVSLVSPTSARAQSEPGRSALPTPALPTRWVRPVDGPVTRPFVAPAFAYGPGHRGADLAAPVGSPVRAAGSGVVTFAGAVADGRHVVVTHGSGLRTGYSFLAELRVSPGQLIAAGTVVGVTGGGDVASDHDPAVLHFSLRRGDTYLDPMLLFAPVDLTAVVRLAPLPPGWR